MADTNREMETFFPLSSSSSSSSSSSLVTSQPMLICFFHHLFFLLPFFWDLPSVSFFALMWIRNYGCHPIWNQIELWTRPEPGSRWWDERCGSGILHWICDPDEGELRPFPTVGLHWSLSDPSRFIIRSYIWFGMQFLNGSETEDLKLRVRKSNSVTTSCYFQDRKKKKPTDKPTNELKRMEEGRRGGEGEWAMLGLNQDWHRQSFGFPD